MRYSYWYLIWGFDMLEIIWLVLVIAAFYGVGRRLLDRLNVVLSTAIESFVFSFAIGAGLGGYTVLAIGALGLLYKWVLAGLVILLLAISYKEIIYMIKKITNYFSKLKADISARAITLSIFLKLLFIIFIAFNFIAALAPVSEWDSLTYHLASPKTYLRENGINYLPTIAHSNQPLLAEMMYTLSLGLSSEILASLLSFFIGICLAMGVYSFSRRHFSENISLVSTIIFYSLPIISVFTSTPKNDITFAFFSFLAFYAFILWMEKQDTKFLALSGVLSGMAASTKILGLIIPALIFVLYLAQQIMQKNFRKAVKGAAVLLACSAIFSLPFYIKTYIYTGNPVWPFMYSVFGGIGWSHETAERFAASIQHGMGKSIISLILLPWNLTMHSQAFGNIISLSPLFLMLLPILLFIKKIPKAIKLILGFSLLYTLIWFFMSQQMRFLMPLLPLLSIAAAYIIAWLSRHKIIYKIAFAVVLFTLLYGLLINCGINAKKAPAALGIEDKGAYLDSLKDWSNYDAVAYINNNLPQNAVILLYKETRGFYLDRKYFIGEPLIQALIKYKKGELKQRLQLLGITHILVNEAIPGYAPGKGVYTIEEDNAMQDILKESRMVYERRGIKVYETGFTG